jgi:hypothetical protein
MPLPDHVPPDGVPPLIAKPGAFAHTTKSAPPDTVGNALTVIFFVAVLAHPVWLEKV